MIIIILLILYYYIIYQNGIIINSNKNLNKNSKCSNLNYNNLKYTIYKEKLIINSNEYITFWYYKQNNISNNTKTIIYFPGYLESNELYFSPNRAILFTNYPYNMNFIIFDYRGIGESKGIYNEENMLSDGIYLLNYLLDHKNFNININNIILYGFSIGTLSVLFLNKYLIENNLKPNKIILEAPLYKFSLNNLINKFIKFYINYSFTINILDYLKYIKSPILILHGNKDTIISSQQSKNILKNYN